MECVKSQVLLLFDIFNRGEKHGAVYQTKNFIMKLKFYRVFWTADHGRDATGDRPEIADFNCINNLKR